jgi:transcriptional regulator with XRE-family HTH domain
MQGRRRAVEVIPREQAAIVGANIRTLRQTKGWTQSHVGALMGWASNSTVCAAEGHRDSRQRGFTTNEVKRLAGIFGVKTWQLTTRCETCDGHPPNGFACLTCGTRATVTAGNLAHVAWRAGQ